MKTIDKKVALITGSAGFIGFHISKQLISEGWKVIGVDCLSDYYSVSLKKHREDILLQSPLYRSVRARIEEPDLLFNLFKNELPNIVIHLAAQAGVRHSIENPRNYLESNIVGTFELLEAARAFPPEHMLMASTSSVYGANEQMPYKETDKADHQMSFYASTKKAMESMAHSYSHLFDLPITMFRFFTVYGPWGRPDMAVFKFTEAILNGKSIDVYNQGEMRRDFTYIDDLISGIMLLIDAVPNKNSGHNGDSPRFESLSPVASFRVVNIGNSKPETLLDFIKAIETALGKKAKKNLMQMQSGDVPATWADNSLINYLTGYRPETNLHIGTQNFVHWYCEYYKSGQR